VKAVDLGRFDGAPDIHASNQFKRRNTMNEESKNIETKDEQIEQDVKPAELSEQELDKVAGGGASGVQPASSGFGGINASRGNTRNN
jgi:hypothetical protein